MVKSVKIYQPNLHITPRPREPRGSRHERGYDSVWTRRSATHLRQNPICVECERQGIIAPAALVDHKIPIRWRPDLRLDRRNWWSLCLGCHAGMKRRMELYAERTGQVEKLILWCDNPAERPSDFARAPRHRPPKEELIV